MLAGIARIRNVKRLSIEKCRDGLTLPVQTYRLAFLQKGPGN